MSQQQQQNLSQVQSTVSQKLSHNPDSTPTRSQGNISKNANLYFNYGGGSSAQSEDQADVPKTGLSSQKNVDFQFSAQQQQQNQKQYNSSWFNEPSFHQYGKQQSLHQYEPPSTTRNQQMQQVPCNQNMYNVPSNSLMNSVYQSQIGTQPPTSSNQMPNEILMQLAMAQSQNSNYPPQQQQQMLQQQLQLINSLLQTNQNAPQPRTQMIPEPQPSSFTTRSNLSIGNNPQNPMFSNMLNQGLMTPSQQKSFMTPWNDQSSLPTPLDSSRYMMEQNSTNPMHQMSTQSQPSPQFQQYVPQQHHQFVNNYQQHLDNLNQYKKLVTLLESIDQKKANPGVLQPTLPTFTPMEKPSQPYQQNFMGFMQQVQSQPSALSFQTQATKKEEIQDKGQKFEYANETLGNVSIAWPSVSKQSQDQILDIEGKERSAYNTFNQQSSKKGADQAFNMKESYLEQKIDDMCTRDMIEIANQQRNMELKERGQNEKSLNLMYQDDASKMSGGEVTKGSITDILNNNAAQVNVSEENKSLEEYQNQSQMSNDSKQGRLIQSITKSNDCFQNDNGEQLENNEYSQRSNVDNNNSQNYMSTNEGDGLIGMSNENMKEIIDDKPIVHKQMTFEELLESKLQEEGNLKSQVEIQEINIQESKQTHKREFLRKSSNIRGQGNQERPKSKYKYYTDNFNDQAPTSANRTQQNSQQMQNSPKMTSSHQRSTMNESNVTNSVGKRHYQNQKSNQKQPKQQNNGKQVVQPRPQSSQQQNNQQTNDKAQPINYHVAQPNIKQQNLSQPRSRQSIQMANVATVNSNQSRGINPVDLEEENLISERSSVLEFEMLEKECIQKSENKTKKKKEEQKKTLDNKQSAELQKQIDYKIKDLDFEIDKFKKENKKVSLMQKECESQLLRINKEIEEFEDRKEQDMAEMETWKKEQVKEIEAERSRLEEEMMALQQEKDSIKTISPPQKSKQQDEQQMNLIKQQQEELQRLRRYVQSLEGENKDLKDKLDELTDKQVHCVGIQTEPNQEQKLSPTKEQSSVRKNNEILMMSEVEQIIEEEEGEDGSKHSSGKVEDENDFCRIDSEVNQTNEDQDVEFNEESKQEVGQISERKPESNASQDEEEEEDDDEDEYELKFLPEYHGPSTKKVKLTEEVIGHDGKIQRIFENGKKEVVFSNGVKREVWPDGYSLVQFNNNDVKQTFPDGKIVYYFSDAKTTQTTFPNGLQVFKFSNSQIEKHFVDGTKEISFPDGTIKCLFPDGEEESIFPDGTIQKIEKSGTKIVEFPNGQKDILYSDGTKVREYEDGTIKKILPDGKTQTIPPTTNASKKVLQTPVTQKKLSQLSTPGTSNRMGVNQSVKRK